MAVTNQPTNQADSSALTSRPACEISVMTVEPVSTPQAAFCMRDVDFLFDSSHVSFTLKPCCFVCLGCSIASDMDECCLCGLSVAICSVYRTRYNIRGSLCNDFMAVGCCPLCATCQLKRDIDRRKEQSIF